MNIALPIIIAVLSVGDHIVTHSATSTANVSVTILPPKTVNSDISIFDIHAAAGAPNQAYGISIRWEHRSISDVGFFPPSGVLNILSPYDSGSIPVEILICYN